MNKISCTWRSSTTGLGLLLLALTGCASTPDASSSSSLPSSPSLAAAGPEQIFTTPEKASFALADANRRDDKATLLKILGPSGGKIISSGDKIADKEGRDAFVTAYDKSHSFEDGSDGEKTLVVGDDPWPFPIPLVHVMDSHNPAGGWQFDTEVGQQEILNRRIGGNEMDAIQFCHVYVEAQREYAAQHVQHYGTNEYAQHFMSHKGAHDGLYWPASAGEQESPLGPIVADARAEGYDQDKGHKHHRPYHGYYYKIIKAQGVNAPGGAQSYVHDGHMTSGFALIAFPARYGDSGIMSFIVDQNGIVFQKNLGTDTAEIARQMKDYNPDDSWSVAKIDPE